jgi:hypothetical protein
MRRVTRNVFKTLTALFGWALAPKLKEMKPKAIVNKLSYTAYFILFFMVFIGGSNIAFAQSKKISKEKLWADLDTLYKTINDIHPDMFANISKKEFEARLQKIKTAINTSMTPLEFYDLTMPLIVSLRDGHTVLQLPNYFLKDSTLKLIPLIVKITNDTTIIVDFNFSKQKTHPPEGALIKSINGVSAKELIKTGLTYSDGEMLFFRYRSLAYIFARMMLFHYKFETFRINYDYYGKQDSIIVDGISYKNSFNHKSKDKKDIPYSFEFLNDSIGYINFISFKNLSDFELFSDSVFKTINQKQIKNLIIDIRYNGGGNSALGNELFQYISPVPFQQWGQTTVKYSKERYNFYKYHIREYFLPDISDTALNILIGDKPFGTIETKPADSLISLRYNKLRFSGNKYLLTSNYTFSSAASFAYAFKYFKMGTIIGEETGEPVVCFGDIIYQFLPNTGLQYSVSHKKFYQYGATDNYFHGTIPDYIISDDRALNYTLKLIMNVEK